MEKNKIINGFCYLVDDTVTFVSLYTERKNYYDSYLFNKFLKEYKITEQNIILAYENEGRITPLYTTKHKGDKSITDTDFDSLIEEVYSICINVTKGLHN